MTDIAKAGVFQLGDRTVKRMGYGAMQLAGKGVFGPPKDRAEAVAVLREAVAAGVDHIDTSDFYGPHVTNAIIAEALKPYPADLVIVTKVGARARRGRLVESGHRAGRARKGGPRQPSESRSSTSSTWSISAPWAAFTAPPRARSASNSRRWRG